MMEYFGLDGNSTALAKNGYKDDDAKGGMETRELNTDERKSFRMLAARLNYMAQDDPTIQYSAREICRKMANPTSQDRSQEVGPVPLGYKGGRVGVPMAGGAAGHDHSDSFGQ